jgi:putative endonuclease
MVFVYILKSLKNGSYYVGQTNNVAKRLLRHYAGQSIYTKTRAPYTLIYSEGLKDRTEAMRREREIKSYKGGEAFKKLLS